MRIDLEINQILEAHRDGKHDLHGKVVGFDNIPAVQPLIKDGKMLATIDQFGAQMAAMGIDYGLKELAGEKYSGWVKTEIKMITAKDL